MNNPRKIITDDQIDSVWGNSNFGTRSRREVVDDTMFKCAGGFRSGHTAEMIAIELGLLTRKNTITKLGHRYLWAILTEIKEKATKWDILKEKIYSCYYDEQGNELGEEGGLDVIGEHAAMAFGFL